LLFIKKDKGRVSNTPLSFYIDTTAYEMFYRICDIQQEIWLNPQYQINIATEQKQMQLKYDLATLETYENDK
jgi:hypothetical protein